MHEPLRTLALLLLVPVGCTGQVGATGESRDDADTRGDSPGDAAPSSAQMQVTGTGGSLNLRTGPSTAHPIVREIPEGAIVEVLSGPHEGWFEVSYESSEGFCAGQYLQPYPDPQPDQGGSDERLTVSEIVGGVTHSISQGYGPTSFNYDYSYCDAYGDWNGQNSHCAIDVAIPRGTTLVVPGDATVVTAGGSGYFEDDLNGAAGELRIETVDGALIILGHMSEISVGVGASVAAGSVAGRSGTAGSGDHLHLEVRVPDGAFASGYRTVDPLTFFGP